MSDRSLPKFKLKSVGIFVLGLVSAALALSLRQANDNQGRRHARGFTLITKEIPIPIDGKQADPQAVSYVITIRYQKSDGTWKHVRTYRNAAGKVLKKDVGF